MDCPLRSGHDFAEAYVAGTMPEAEQDAYEQHFFSCSLCLSQVQTLQALADRLREQPAPAVLHRAAGFGLDRGTVAGPGARGRPRRGVRLVVAGRRESAGRAPDRDGPGHVADPDGSSGA